MHLCGLCLCASDLAQRMCVCTDLCSDGTTAGTLCPAATGSAVSSTCPSLDANSKCYAGGEVPC